MRLNPRGLQLRIRDWRRPPQIIPLAHLATEVSRAVCQFLEVCPHTLPSPRTRSSFPGGRNTKHRPGARRMEGRAERNSIETSPSSCSRASHCRQLPTSTILETVNSGTPTCLCSPLQRLLIQSSLLTSFSVCDIILLRCNIGLGSREKCMELDF